MDFLQDPRRAPLTAPAPYFRKAFTLGFTPAHAELHVTALGLYECEINSRTVGDAVFAPGWTDYAKRVYFQSYDVTSCLKPGGNALGLILGDGWYAGHIAGKDRGYYGQRPQALLHLNVTAPDGTVHSFVSDGSWKTSAGPILESDIMAGESYDARLELGAWSSPAYDDQAWQPVLTARNSGPVIERSPGPPVRRHEILPGRKMDQDRMAHSRLALFDFGQNLAGRIRLTVKGRRDVCLKIRHAEVLQPDGSIYTENLRRARATDFYVLKGGETETWEPRFTFHGFRYAEISWDAWEEGVALDKVEAVVLHSDMAMTGTFGCSHELLNQLEHNIVWSQKGNFLDVPTDCPQRDERLGWTGDAQVFIRAAAFHMDVRGFFHKWLRDIRDAQDAEGAVPPVVPNANPYRLEPDGGPAWADATFICPWTIYRCYGDTEILREHYHSMARYLDYLAAHKVRNHIRAHPDVDKWGGFGDWLALDGSGTAHGGTPRDLIGTAFYAHDADLMSRIAGVLGRDVDAQRYRALHDDIARAFRNRFVTPDGLLASGTQTAYGLALHFGLLPPEARATAARELVRNIERNGWHLATGFVGTPYLLHVLEAHGHLDVAYRVLEQESFPSWLFPVKNGATTIWERWDGWTPEKGFQNKGMNSFNHYAYGAVGDWLVSTVAGLEIAEPGYRKILFKPRPGGTITWAEAKLRTPQGEAAIRWEVRDGQLVLDLVVPAGSEAILSLPEEWRSEGSRIGPGTHRLVTTRSS